MRYLVFLISILVLFVSCSQDVAGGIEEGNPGTIVGTVYQQNGISDSGAVVTCLPIDYMGDSLVAAMHKDTTDKSGTFSFEQLPDRVYRVSVKGSTRSGYISDSITIKSDTVTEDCHLSGLGSIKIKWPNAVTEEQVVGIAGTPLWVTAEVGTSEVVLDSIPAGEIPAILNSVTGENITTDKALTENDTVVLYMGFHVAVLMASESSLNKAALKSQVNLIKEICDSVSYISSATFTEADLIGVSLLFVSYDAALHADQATFLQSFDVPIISGNGEISAQLGMTGSVVNSDYGTESPQSMLTYYSTKHPILTYTDPSQSGVIGTDLSLCSVLEWGAPNAKGAVILGTSSVDQKHALLYSYEKGTTMSNGNAPAKRAFIWCGETVVPDAVAPLFQGTLLWGAGFLK